MNNNIYHNQVYWSGDSIIFLNNPQNPPQSISFKAILFRKFLKVHKRSSNNDHDNNNR